ncbi:MAG: hypothetical protein EXS01_06860 [Phycisphaerales bacterium]|nr:hypothetical protein [Phycisphaerales bacterium]
MRVLVILPSTPSIPGGTPSLGSRASLAKSLATQNTFPESEGGDIWYGPGIEFQLAPNQDPVVQMLLVVTDEDIAWLVIERIGKLMKWKFVDINTGNELVL